MKRAKYSLGLLLLSSVFLVSYYGMPQNTRIGGGGTTSTNDIIPPHVFESTPPAYTREAIDAGIEGTVTLEASVDVRGQIKILRVIKGLGYGLDERAMGAASNWKFIPAIRNGIAVQAITQIDVTFKLPKSAQVVGTLTLMVGPSDSAGGTASVAADRQIELPDIDVYLRNAVSGISEPKKKTQLDGKFHLLAPSAGTYTVCWTAPGIGAGCGSRFNVDQHSVYLNVVPVPVTKGGVVYGKVLTADDRPCWLNDPFFALDVSTFVILFNSSQSPVQPFVRANTYGEYAFAGLSPDKYRVRASCEKARGEAMAPMGSFAPVLANVTLPNHAPKVAGIAAFDSANGITRAAPGQTVKVDALVRDIDNDPVEHLWRALDGSGSLIATNLAQQQWTTGPAAGIQTVYTMARDGKGGYAYKRFDMQVGGKGVSFSGRVIDEISLNPVAKAQVTVNGAGTMTNAQGWFSLTTAIAPSPERYVLNIDHPQYVLLSSIHDKASAGETYALIRAQRTTHDPSLPIVVTDNESSGPCGNGKPAGPLKGSPTGANPKTGDTRQCRRVGATLSLPAGALVDADQKPAQGPVTLEFATLNPARRSLPGDYRAITNSIGPAELLSYGAVYVQFTDPAGRHLNLRPGSLAEISQPMPVEQLSSSQPTIAMWSYDESRGVWVEEDQATLKNTLQGPMYVGYTKHFSTINMDVAGNDPAEATCVRFELGDSLDGWNNLFMRAYVSYGGTAVQVKETQLNGDQYHAIYRIPYAPPAPGPNTLRLELRGTYGGQEVVLLDDIINTDARPKMTGNNLWPDYPYTECGDVITLEADPINLPYYGNIDATGRPAFLTGPYGQFLPANGEQIATDYYNTIDPGDDHPTLSLWWTNHNFNADGSGGTRAAYLNHNDLGFGRDMNCKTNGGDLACFVTNYGAPDQNAGNADDALDQVAGKRGATVAMEYKSSESADRRVRFYVYGGGDPTTAGKLKFADLDGLGPKSVPHLCLVCHGGTYDDATNNTVNARFREFDLQSFKYSGDRSWDYPPAAASNNLTADELTAFATLNQMVRDIQPNSSAIKELINNWYPGGFGPGTKPSQTAVPPGWNTEATFYRNVYGKSCRTCHVARDGGNANAPITFPSSSNFQFTDYVVCGSPKVMPNAYITYKNFWNDLQRVIDFKNFTGAASCQ
jgi:TonB family protein